MLRRNCKLMGNQFEFLLLHENESFALECYERAVLEIKRIEGLLSTYKPDSETNKINNSAGIEAVIVESEVYHLIGRSLKISRLTQGAFDISYGSIDNSFWNFDINMTSLPSKEIAQKSVRLINYQNVVLNKENQSIFLENEGMKIGFGGIGKGYAADKAKALLVNLGIEAGVVNASGDIITWGKQENGKDWSVGIADPNQKEKPFSYLNISDLAIATSGNYEKFAVIDNKKYSHTIDPKTGFPCEGIDSVTIIAPTAELADALTTPVMVMGVEVGLDLINQLNGFACVIVDTNNKIFVSKNIKS